MENIQKEVKELKTVVIDEAQQSMKNTQNNIENNIDKVIIDNATKCTELSTLMNDTKVQFSERFQMMEKADKDIKQKVENVNKDIIQVKDMITNKLISSDEDSDDESTDSEMDTPASNKSTKSDAPARNKPTDVRKPTPPNDQENYDVWIIGSSLVKDLRPKKMYRNKKIRVTTLQDKTVSGAIQFLKSGKVKADTVLYQIGSNDLEENSPDDVMKEVEELVNTTKEILPNANISFVEILPRFYDNITKLTQFDQKRMLYNNLLKDYCVDLDAKYVKFNNMIADCFYDGIHFNEKGVRIYVKYIKEVLNPILGVNGNQNTVHDNNNRNGMHNYNQNNRYGIQNYNQNSRTGTQNRFNSNLGRPAGNSFGPHNQDNHMNRAKTENYMYNMGSGQVYPNYNHKPENFRQQYQRYPNYNYNRQGSQYGDQNQGQMSGVGKENIFRRRNNDKCYVNCETRKRHIVYTVGYIFLFLKNYSEISLICL